MGWKLILKISTHTIFSILFLRNILTLRVWRTSSVSLSVLVSCWQLLNYQLISWPPPPLNSLLFIDDRAVRTPWVHTGGRAALRRRRIGGRGARRESTGGRGARRESTGGRGARRGYPIPPLTTGGRGVRREYPTQLLTIEDRGVRRKMGFLNYKWQN